MNNETFSSVCSVVLPGNHVTIYVVEETSGETSISQAVEAGVPPAAALLLLAQLLSSCLPAGLAAFHAWKSYTALRANFEEINHQMANVPAISEDELPF